jgi:predicted glycogen debranching enzyme
VPADNGGVDTPPESRLIQIPKTILKDPDTALAREWLVTNGIGGYASSTILGANTRRYHGLLVASFPPPIERQVVLSKVDEELVIGRKAYPLGTNEYQGEVIHPEGFRHLESFRLELGIPTFEYAVAGVGLVKQVWMEQGQDTVYVLYTLLPSGSPTPNTKHQTPLLRIRPFCAFRGYHQDGRREGLEEFVSARRNGHLIVQSGHAPYSVKMMLSPRGSFDPAEDWYRDFFYRVEQERGFDCREDLYTPGTFSARLSPGESVCFIATCERSAPDLDFEGALAREMSRRREIARKGRDAFCKQLLLAADQFIVHPPSSAINHQPSTILAGYPWFTEWGRDTMISLPGLLLSTGRFDEAREILLRYIECADGGMIPNRFTDEGAVEYNTADATLWYFQALNSYVRASGDDGIIRRVFPSLAEIVDWHFRGTRFGIHVDPHDGLLIVGRDGSQVTWMDACVEGSPVTPRIGKPVEINALWFNALSLMAVWARHVGASSSTYEIAAERCEVSFRRRFWNPETGCLFDVTDGPLGDDSSIRPNQIMAVSLPYSPLYSRQRASVVDVVERKLLTPYGLRSLSPDDPAYAGEYRGGSSERDSVYHQGAAWPWLLCRFADAHYRVYRDRERIIELFRPFRKHIKDAGLGTVSEIFDGDPPHRPNGCISQAWSIAEILRVCTEIPLMA